MRGLWGRQWPNLGSAVKRKKKKKKKTEQENYFKDKVFIFTVQSLILYKYSPAFLNVLELYRSDMLYIFTWFCPCFQRKDSSVYPHFPYRDNDMIFQILNLLSNSHAAVVNGRAFEFEPTRDRHYHKRFIENSLHASCSILCGIHSADETQSGRNSCLEFAFLTFSLDSFMSLSR